MAVTPQIVHVCNHKIETGKRLSEVMELTRAEAVDADIVPEGIQILSVGSLYEVVNAGSLEYNFYYENLDFILSGRSTIIWIVGGRRPKVGSKYHVQCSYIKPTLEEYDYEDCPRCSGAGWYVDFTPQSEAEVSQLRGMSKIVQDILKMLFTYREQGSDYGTRLIDYAGAAVHNPSNIASEISSMIIGCATKYKEIQATTILNGGRLTDDELLEKIIIDEIEYDDISGSIYVYATLYNMSGVARDLGIGF